jgi:hypothetical protein
VNELDHETEQKEKNISDVLGYEGKKVVITGAATGMGAAAVGAAGLHRRS